MEREPITGIGHGESGPGSAAAGWPRGVSHRGGFRLTGTPLGFSGCAEAGLLFVSDVDQPPPRRGRRVLATPFVSAAIGARERGLDALNLEFGRRIRLGRLDIRLLPAGRGPGAALLEVVLRGRRIVHCGGVRLSRPLHGPRVEIPPCDLLLLDTQTADPKPPSSIRTGRGLADWAASALAGGCPVIACAGLAAAMEAARSLMDADLEVRAFRPLYEMLHRVEGQGLPLAGLRRLEDDLPSGEVVLHSAATWPATRLARASGLAVARAGPGRDRPAWASRTFRLGEGEDRPGLVEFVRGTGAKEVALGPGCDDDETAAAVRRTGAKVFRASRPAQIALPL